MTQITDKYEGSAELLRILAHPVRLGLVKLMLTDGPINVTTMYEGFNMPQSTISQHLAKLRAAKIISGTRKGLEVFYEVIDSRAKAILSSLDI
jgi:DNA-binding transcriptional ArsR family regulator